jgi:hypothetical protein
MTKRNIFIDSSWPRDDMRVLITDDGDTDIVMHMSSKTFLDIFGVFAKEGLYLEIDIENVTEEKRAEVRAIQRRLGLK